MNTTLPGMRYNQLKENQLQMLTEAQRDFLKKLPPGARISLGRIVGNDGAVLTDLDKAWERLKQ